MIKRFLKDLQELLQELFHTDDIALDGYDIIDERFGPEQRAYRLVGYSPLDTGVYTMFFIQFKFRYQREYTTIRTFHVSSLSTDGYEETMAHKTFNFLTQDL